MDDLIILGDFFRSSHMLITNHEFQGQIYQMNDRGK